MHGHTKSVYVFPPRTVRGLYCLFPSFLLLLFRLTVYSVRNHSASVCFQIKWFYVYSHPKLGVLGHSSTYSAYLMRDKSRFHSSQCAHWAIYLVKQRLWCVSSVCGIIHMKYFLFCRQRCSPSNDGSYYS